ncbi:phosphate ABC transporter permease PstA [Cerasicoccus maritimus]|uniref:phosphate ABC transporter permease PstA n=1 Tax=Cerasicoccus maritimus TaxID=490089 RepID=UPI0028527A43|nr:ABC transporter permease subunit [Cerasicoccus maritimus]
MSEKKSKGFDTKMRPAGEMYVWLCGMGLASGIIMVIGLLWIIVANGVEVFWPRPVYQVKMTDGSVVAASIVEDREKKVAEAGGDFKHEYKLFTGNKDVGPQFRYVDHDAIESMDVAEGIWMADREGSGKAIFYPVELTLADGKTVSAESPEFKAELQGVIDAAEEARHQAEVIDKGVIRDYAAENKELVFEIRLLQNNNPDERKDLQQMDELYKRINMLGADAQDQRAELMKEYDELASRGGPFAQLMEIHDRSTTLFKEYEEYFIESDALKASIKTTTLRYKLIDGTERSYTAGEILNFYQPNEFGFLDKVKFFIAHFWMFVTDSPREGATEGGIFPAIIGTFVMTVLMSAAVMPFGVLAAIYLREYAAQGLFTQAVRIAVNNLAGVPSIVYGVFGLAFFVYGMGSWIDSGAEDPMAVASWSIWLIVAIVVLVALLVLAQEGLWKTRTWMPNKFRQQAVSGLSIVFIVLLGCLIYYSPFFNGFFADRAMLNEPTFGSGGVLWASLTLALMTVPVVVVATEEALAAVPRGVREASLACGASKWQTIQRIVMPASASGILTGLILAMARGAGEVAPLMLVGVINHVEELPIDASYPFFHFERKFMHLGFHIYDLGFQSPDSEAAKPMVFATTFLLIVLVVVLNLGAILIRDHLRKKYATGTF